jgi:hypothetical protein
MILAGVVLHFLLYGAAIPFSFSWDDRKIVLDGPTVNGQRPLSAAFVQPWAYEEGARGVNYRPVTLFSLGLDVRLFGLRPEPLRVVNLVLAGAGAGLFGLLVRSLGASPFAAWWTVVLLSCHPVRSEPILSIAGRGEILAFLFVAGALLAWRRALLSALLLLLGLLSKESAFVAPALLVLVVALERRMEGPGSSVGDGGPSGGRWPRLALAWGAAFAVAFAARVAVLGGLLTGAAARISPADNLLAALPAGERIAGALSLIPLAFERLLWPATLSPDYSRTTFLVADLLAAPAVVRGVVALAAALLLTAALFVTPASRRRAPLLGFGLAWALFSYLPFANLLFPTGVAFTERLLFLPASGIVVAAVAVLATLFTGPAPRGAGTAPTARRLSAVLVGVLLALLGAARIVQVLPDWQDDRTLMEAIERDLPTNSKAPWNLTLLSLGEGKTDEASRHLARAVALDPNYRRQAAELVRHAEELGKKDMADALSAAVRAAERRPPVR